MKILSKTNIFLISVIGLLLILLLWLNLGQINQKTDNFFSYIARLLVEKEEPIPEPLEEIDINFSAEAQESEVFLGQVIPFEITLSNQGSLSVEDVFVRLLSDDFSIRQVKLDGYEVEDNVAFLTDELEFNRQLKISPEVVLTGQQDFQERKVKITVRLSYLVDKQTYQQEKEVDIKILPYFKAQSAAYYYSPQGDQIGLGPLPPRVSIPTTYWIFWQVEPYVQEVDRFLMTAQLPKDVVWTGRKVPLDGNLKFGQVNRRVVWEINPKNCQGLCRANFEIQVIPEESNIGQIMNLLTEIEFEAIHQDIAQKIKGSLRAETTFLEDDELASDQGQVVPYE